MSVWRSRWAALGAAVAVSLGAGGLGLVGATIDSGERPVVVTIAPQRILDTRANLGLTGRFLNESPRDLQVTGDVPVASGGTTTVVPTDAVAVVVNVTVVNPDSSGYLSLRPSGATGTPSTSTVNFTAGSIEPNAATVALGPGGRVQIFVKTAASNGTVDVLVDVVGYTADHTHDDLYYTKTEADARFERTPDDVVVNIFDMAPVVSGTNWLAFGKWDHIPSGTTFECLYGAVDLPVGAEVDGVAVSYRASTNPFVTTSLIGTRHTTGSVLEASYTLVNEVSAMKPTTPLGAIGSYTAPSEADNTVRDDHNHVVGVRTKDSLSVYGVTVSLD